MRKQTTFKIEGYEQQFTVKELTVKEILNLIQMDSGKDPDMSLAGIKQQFTDVFLPLCTNVDLDMLIDMAPSEIEELWTKFQEVNSAFFALTRKAGLEELLEKLKSSIIVDFSKLLANLSKPDIPES